MFLGLNFIRFGESIDNHSVVNFAPRCQLRWENGRQCDMAGTICGNDGKSYCSHDHMYQAFNLVQTNLCSNNNNLCAVHLGAHLGGKMGAIAGANAGAFAGAYAGAQAAQQVIANAGVIGNGVGYNAVLAGAQAGRHVGAQVGGVVGGNIGANIGAQFNAIQSNEQKSIGNNNPANVVASCVCGIDGCKNPGKVTYGGCCDFYHQRIRDQRVAVNAIGHYVNPYAN